MMMQPLAALGVGIAIAIEIRHFRGVSGGITSGFGSSNEDFLETLTGSSAGSAIPLLQEVFKKLRLGMGLSQGLIKPRRTKI
jgi:hypothetical protein